MQRWRIAAIAILIGWLSPAQAQLDPQVEKLQKSIQKVISQSENAIACILVSRSDAYQRITQAPTRRPAAPKRRPKS